MEGNGIAYFFNFSVCLDNTQRQKSRERQDNVMAS